MDLFFVIGLAAYLISLGMRGIRWASGHESGRDGRIKWGRVYLGALLIFIEIKNHLHPAPNLLKPSNEGEAAGMILTAIVLATVGAWLVVSGVMSRFRRRTHEAEGSKIAS
jgi:hypothetical protein